MLEFTFKEMFDAWCDVERENNNEEWVNECVADDGENCWQHHATEMGDLVRSWLHDVCDWNIDDVRHIVTIRDEYAIDTMASLASCISNEFDTNQRALWNAFDLSGDDDVDYNGGYIHITCDTMRRAIKRRTM